MENSRGKGASADGEVRAAAVGSVIADTYVIERVIGRGGMGTVFLASHRRLPGKQVAIKMLHVDTNDPGNEEVLLRFQREAEIASSLGHPNIVGVDDFNTLPDGTPYLVLEYLDGVTLAHRLREGPVPNAQALSIVRQVGSALAAAHRAGVVHRDLKPHNIFLCPTEVDGEVIDIAKVLDFGISKIKGSQTVKTQDSALLGTPQYMSPEQATGQHTIVDERTDVFAFGSIVYEMLSGRPAFTGASIPEVVFKVVYEEPTPLVDAEATSAVAAAVARAMAKSPEERFSTVSAFVEAVTGQAIPPPRIASLPPPDDGVPVSAKISTNEAFAHTESPSNLGKKVVRPISRAASPVAETIVSQSSPAPRQGNLGKLVVIGVVAAAVAATVVYFVMRGEAAPAAVIDAAVAIAHVDAAAHVADVAIPIDALTPDAAMHVDARVDAHVAIEAHPGTISAPLPPELKALLGQARAAMQRGDFDQTTLYTDQVINAPEPSEEASHRAHALRAIMECKQSAQSEAMSEARASHHVADAEVRAACAPFNIEINY